MELLPLEVKAGPQGRLRSLHQFVERAEGGLGMRALEAGASVEFVRTPRGYDFTLLNVPICAVSYLSKYIQWAYQEIGV